MVAAWGICIASPLASDGSGRIVGGHLNHGAGRLRGPCCHAVLVQLPIRACPFCLEVRTAVCSASHRASVQLGRAQPAIALSSLLRAPPEREPRPLLLAQGSGRGDSAKHVAER